MNEDIVIKFSRIGNLLHQFFDVGGGKRLRHVDSPRLLSKGAHSKVVSEMVGQSTITLALEACCHLGPVLYQQAATTDTMFAA